MKSKQLRVTRHTAHMGSLVIKPIAKATAARLTIAHHYSHKWQHTFGLYSFGIFRAGQEDEDHCLGLAAIGWMKNPKARLFTSAVPAGRMLELNRMWIDDALGKNAESILIAASIRLLKIMDPTCVALQSFADGRIGCGTIYKAANFQYYGHHTTRFLLNKRSGEISHEQNVTNSTAPATFFRNWAWLLCGDADCFTTRTYRYIYPLHPSFRYTGPGRLQPYPQYHRGTSPTTWPINPDHIRNRLLLVLDKLLKRYPYQKNPNQ